MILGAAFLSLLFLVGTFGPSLLHAAGRPSAAAWMRVAHAPLCHQLPDRSLKLAGHPQAVCARCCGLYLGGVLGLLVAGLRRCGGGQAPRPLWLALAVAPSLVDALLPWIGLPGLSNIPRLLLAVPAGLVAALFLGAALADSVIRYTIERSGAVEARDPLEARNG